MQAAATYEMTLQLEPVKARPRRATTSPGFDAWLFGTHAGPASTEVEKASADWLEQADAAEPEAAAPVNAADALALSRTGETSTGARKLVGADGAELIVDPEHDAYYFESTSLKPLAPLLQQPPSAWTPVDAEALQRARTSASAQPLERLRWYAGLIATPGILNRALRRNDPYHLSRWPETEREFPKHFRIAKEMLLKPATIGAIAVASRTTCDDVIDYINASLAAGRLEPTPGEVENDPPANRREHLFARLFAR